MRSDERQRLRGMTLLKAPLFLVGVIGCTLALATVLWGVWNPDHLGLSFRLTLGASVVVGLGAFWVARGCFIDVDGAEVRDVVGWVTCRRLPRQRIVTARVRAGVWRWFEVELDDSTRHVLVGASPAQFPARLMPGARADDLAELDVLLGED